MVGPTYAYASNPAKAMVALEDAGHMIFTALCEAIPLLMRFIFKGIQIPDW